jgi:hypothetical protein
MTYFTHFGAIFPVNNELFNKKNKDKPLNH